MDKNLIETYRKQMFDRPIVKQFVDLKNVTELLEHIKKQYGNDNAVTLNDGKTKTFNDLYKDVLSVASSLSNVQGHIGIFIPNSYEFEVAALAIMASGKVAVCFPASLNKDQLPGLCKQLDVQALVYDKKLEANTVNVAIAKKEVNSLFGVDAKQDILKTNIQEKDPACILLTGGTTGIPKGVVLSHTAIMRGTINGCYGLDKVFKQKYYCMIPLTHSFGFIRNMLCALYTGSCIYYNQDKMQMFKELATFQPTVLIIVPAIAELFLGMTKAHSPKILGGQVHTIICGSANVPPYLPLQFSQLGIDFCPGYGLTEFANMVSGNPNAVKYSQSVGLLFPEQEAKIVDGELWLKGRNMMNQYYKNEVANKEAFSDGWFKTGDLAKFDEYGNLYIVGRIKDLIVLDNGEKVSPAYLEAKALKIDLIKDALVYDIRNEHNVQNLVLEVTLRESITAKIKDPKAYLDQELIKINKDLQAYEQITKIIIRDKDFERSPAMKILRKKH